MDISTSFLLGLLAVAIGLGLTTFLIKTLIPPYGTARRPPTPRTAAGIPARGASPGGTRRMRALPTLLVLLLLAVGLWWFNRQDFRWGLPRRAVAVDECTNWNPPWAATTSRTITVGRQWQTVEIPFCHGLDMDPVGEPILWRPLNGPVFEKTPNGENFENGRPVVGRIRIPGHSVRVSSKSGNPVQVVLTTEPRK